MAWKQQSAFISVASAVQESSMRYLQVKPLMVGKTIRHRESLRRIFYLLFLLSPILFVSCRGDLGERTNVLRPSGEDEIVIMDFSAPLSLDPIEPGWYHHKFFWHQPMTVEFVEKE